MIWSSGRVATTIDPDGLREKYRIERDKRRRADGVEAEQAWVDNNEAQPVGRKGMLNSAGFPEGPRLPLLTRVHPNWQC
jgi:hypothetical protein